MEKRAKVVSHLDHEWEERFRDRAKGRGKVGGFIYCKPCDIHLFTGNMPRDAEARRVIAEIMDGTHGSIAKL